MNDSSPKQSASEEDPSDLQERLAKLSPLMNLLDQARDAVVSPLAKGDTDRLAHLDLKPPDRLGDFELLSPIGRGGMGVVYEARQRSLDRIVALKVLPKSVLPDSEIDSGVEPTAQQNLVKRFHVEARAAAKLHHTNIVPVYGFGEDAGFYFFVMQRIYGQSLDRWIANQYTSENESQLSDFQLAKVAGRFGCQAASALAYAHGEGILHRDVKPANLLIDEDDNLCIADFGIARIDDAEALTRTSDVVGTLRYMAPEQVIGDSTPQSDVYSLGVTLYELVTGSPAIDDASVRNAVLLQKKPNPPVPLSKCKPGLPVDLRTIIEKAMMPEVADRYESASAFEDDLQRFLDGRSIVARRMPWFERGSRWIGKNRTISTLASMVILALSLAAGISIYGQLKIGGALNRERVAKAAAQNSSDLATTAMEEIFGRFSSSADASTMVFEATDFSAPSVDPKTASLLGDLLGYYDALASMRNGPDDDNDRVSTGTARMHVGTIYQQLGNQTAAIAAFEQARRYVGDNNLLVARLENQIGVALQAMGQNAQSKKHHRIALDRLTENPTQASEPIVRFEIARSRLLAMRRLRPGMGPQELPPAAGFEFEPWLATVQRPEPPPFGSLAPPIDANDEQIQFAIDELLQLKQDCPDSVPVTLLLTTMVREGLRDSIRSRMHPAGISPEMHLARQLEHELETIIHEQTLTGNDAAARYELVRLLTDFTVFRPIRPPEAELAFGLLDRAIPHAEHLIGRFPNVPAYENLAIHTWFKAAMIQSLRAGADGVLSDAEYRDVRSLLRQAYQHQSFLLERNPQADGYRLWCCLFLMHTGDLQLKTEDPPAAFRSYRRALRLMSQTRIFDSEFQGDEITHADGSHPVLTAGPILLGRFAELIDIESAVTADLIAQGFHIDGAINGPALRQAIDGLIENAIFTYRYESVD